MSDNNQSSSKTYQTPRRKLWPWAITSVVAVLAALFLTVWVPQEQGEELLQRIEAAGGSYTLDTSERPEAGSLLEDFEYVELFDRVDHLSLPKVDSELFRDAVAAFASLETLEFDLANSPDFDREAAARMTELDNLVVIADEQLEKTDYAFLAGCQSVESLYLSGDFHDDGFWEFLPEMNSLTEFDLRAGSNMRGQGIPDLSTSKILSIGIQGDGGTSGFHGFNKLLTAPAMKEITMLGMSLVESDPVKYASPPALESLCLCGGACPDGILTVVSEAKSLYELKLISCQLSGDSLDQLKSLPLERLILDENLLSADSCRDLSELKTLKVLSVKNTGIKSDWIKCWVSSPFSYSLTELYFAGRGEYVTPTFGIRDTTTNNLDDSAIDVLMEFSNLKELTIYQRDYSNDAILKLAGHPTLKRLNIEGKVSNWLIEQFGEKVKQQGKVYPEIR